MDDPLSQAPGQAPVRRYPRMVAEHVVAYRHQLPEGGETAPQFSRTQTLGLGGLMFESDKPLEPGGTLLMEIVLGEQTIKTTGVVVYVESREAAGLWSIGVQFTVISEDDRDALLSAYLQQEYRIAPA